MSTNPFTEAGCVCPSTADLLRSALAGTEPGEPCPVHVPEEPERPSGRTADPAERRRLMHVVGSGLASMPLNAPVADVAAALGMTVATSTDHNHSPLDAA